MNTTLEQEPVSEALIRFQDCDPMGHLNNGNYIHYFMNAREDHLLKFYDLDVYALLKREGRAWVVAKNEIVYRRPALMMEKVVIKSQVLDFDDTRILVEMSMYDHKMTHLKALLWSVFAPFDVKQNTATSHDERIMELLTAAKLSVAETSIEERVLSIRNALNA